MTFNLDFSFHKSMLQTWYFVRLQDVSFSILCFLFYCPWLLRFKSFNVSKVEKLLTLREKSYQWMTLMKMQMSALLPPSRALAVPISQPKKNWMATNLKDEWVCETDNDHYNKKDQRMALPLKTALSNQWLLHRSNKINISIIELEFENWAL